MIDQPFALRLRTEFVPTRGMIACEKCGTEMVPPGPNHPGTCMFCEVGHPPHPNTCSYCVHRGVPAKDSSVPIIKGAS